MLKLCGSLAVSSDSSPVIRPGDVLMYSCVDHGFNGEDMADFHKSCGFVARIVRDIRGAMEEISDSVATVSTVDCQSKLVVCLTHFLI